MIRAVAPSVIIRNARAGVMCCSPAQKPAPSSASLLRCCPAQRGAEAAGDATPSLLLERHDREEGRRVPGDVQHRRRSDLAARRPPDEQPLPGIEQHADLRTSAARKPSYSRVPVAKGFPSRDFTMLIARPPFRLRPLLALFLSAILLPGLSVLEWIRFGGPSGTGVTTAPAARRSGLSWRPATPFGPSRATRLAGTSTARHASTRGARTSGQSPVRCVSAEGKTRSAHRGQSAAGRRRNITGPISPEGRSGSPTR
jgi:hypothetical protein